MTRPEATVEDILGLLPDLDDLEVLRLRLIAAAVRDPGKEWDSSRDYSTIDKRIVSPEGAAHALEEAKQALHEHVEALHAGLLPIFESFFAGDRDATARRLVALGELLEASGRVDGARRCYRAALAASLPLTDKGPQILALRRIARVSLHLGDFQEAASYYERSAEMAHDSGDLHGEVVARTGNGNVRLWQGRWAEADQCYREALALADAAGPGELTLERGQIYNNLGNLATRLERLEESEGWFELALQVWETHASPEDHAICLHNLGNLREAQGRWDEARRSYEGALKLPVSPAVRSIIAADYAEWWLHEGHLTQAAEYGRVAEEHAIAASSPYTLGHMYLGRGKIARALGDADGFTFFEKALEIARDKGYPFLQAETLVEYAALRAQNDGGEEAVAYLERACEILKALGAIGELERARAALEELRAGAGDLSTYPTGETPLAAAGD